jgi:RNA polymerase sigma-70 factor (ECF subfamily)
MTQSVDTTSLLPSVAQGDTNAFEQLYDRHSGVLYAVLLRILGSPDDAQEVLQETFVKAWTNAMSFDATRGSELAWLITIARSRGIDRLRARRVRGDRENEAGREISIRTGTVEKTTGADNAIVSQERIAVRSALDELPPPQRVALELAYFDGLSQSEIAEKTGEPLGTIKTRMQLGMKKTARTPAVLPMTSHEQFESLAALDAIGAATEEEQRELQAHLEWCPDCGRARDEYDEAAAVLARNLDPVTPPKEARGAIMNAILEDETVVEEGQRDTRWWLSVAAILFFALWAWRELGVRATKEHIASRDAEIESLTEKNNMLTQRISKLTSEMAALGGKDTRVITLTGQQVAPQASARVFLEPAKRRAVVFFANLPANAADKSYQLWIIRGAQPQNAGVFDASAAGTATIAVENLPADTEIKAMAVTVEPRGGVQQPTNANYVVMGKS